MKKNKLLLLFVFLCLCTAIYSGYKIIVWKQNVDRNHQLEKETNKLVEKNEKENLKNKYKVDFKSLKQINPDTVAWIKVNGTDIEYPVVQGKDNNYYLSHNFKKEKNIAGWIFADYKNKFNGIDRNIVLYGHNTKDKSMFGSLQNVLEEKWQKTEKNMTIILVTEKGSSIYQVFSTYTTKPEQYYIQTYFKNGEEFSKFIKTIKERSNHDYEVKVDENDSILTLSSCSNGGDKRVVLHAKKIY